MAGIPVLVLGNKRDLPGALDEHGLIEKMNLNAIQVRTHNALIVPKSYKILFLEPLS